MRLKTYLATLVAVAFLGCGARSALVGASTSTGVAAAGGGAPADAGPAGGAGGASGAGAGLHGPAPVPSCTGENSACVATDGGQLRGTSVIKCDPVYFLGPWTLLLEREVNQQFVVVQVEVVEEPGFGATIYDTTGPPAQLTYRVCSQDPTHATRCGAPFTTYGPVDCACVPFTCETFTACFITEDDGCGGSLHCGACPGGVACNMTTHSCCPAGDESNLNGGCVCAPPGPCHGYWNTSECACDPNN